MKYKFWTLYSVFVLHFTFVFISGFADFDAAPTDGRLIAVLLLVAIDLALHDPVRLLEKQENRHRLASLLQNNL